MKKIATTFLALMLATTLLAGCGHTHVWQDATCTAPKTCTECKEIEGEALAHSLTDVTCAAPKTCTVCGKAEGEALPHSLTPANYQSPAICTVCGANEGEPLLAIFEEKGYSLMSVDVDYEYITVAHNNTSIAETNHVAINNYRIVASDDTHEARDGYEWRIAEMNFTFDDPNVGRYGYRLAAIDTDYYDGLFSFDDPLDINFNGKVYERNIEYTTLKQDKLPDGTGHIVIAVAAQVPIGYDGVVLFIYNAAYTEPVSGVELLTLAEYESANPLFFRMA